MHSARIVGNDQPTALKFVGEREQISFAREIAHVCNNIGYVHLKQGHYPLARNFLQRAFTLAERIGDIPLMSVVLHNMGELALLSSGNGLEEAELYYRRSLTLAEQINDREYLSLWNADLAVVLLKRGRTEDARAHRTRYVIPYDLPLVARSVASDILLTNSGLRGCRQVMAATTRER